MKSYTNHYIPWEREELIELYNRITAEEPTKKLVRRFGRSPQAIKDALRKILSVQLTNYSPKEVAKALNMDMTEIKAYLANEKYDVPLDYSENYSHSIGCYTICMSSILLAGVFCTFGVLSNNILEYLVS